MVPVEPDHKTIAPPLVTAPSGPGAIQPAPKDAPEPPDVKLD
jgi:potassium efflux system protein